MSKFAADLGILSCSVGSLFQVDAHWYLLTPPIEINKKLSCILMKFFFHGDSPKMKKVEKFLLCQNQVEQCHTIEMNVGS